MCKKSADSVFSAVVEKLKSAKSILVLTHGRPDGDGLGSMAAFYSAGKAAGKQILLFVPDNIPPRYEYLFAEKPCTEREKFAELADKCDVVLILDTCAFAQLDGLEDMLRTRREKTVVVDHHATADDVGYLQWTDTSAAAAGVMVTELLEAMDWPIDPSAAESLMTAIVTDTGWLRFANTDARALRAVADLVDDGVRPDKLFRRIYQTDRLHRLELTRRMLGSLELHCNDRIATMIIRKSDFSATGARADETENLVNEALRLASVETAILLVENTDCVRVSLRSRDAVDVAAVAKEFGGGGHHRAAGLRLNENIDALKNKLVTACSKKLKGVE